MRISEAFEIVRWIEGGMDFNSHNIAEACEISAALIRGADTQAKRDAYAILRSVCVLNGSSEPFLYEWDEARRRAASRSGSAV